MEEVSRKKFLKAGCAAAGGAILLTSFPRVALGQTCERAESLGIKIGNSPSLNRTNLITALSNTSRCIRFNNGQYRLDNGPGALNIPGFSGELRMNFGSGFVFTDNTKAGLYFFGGSGAIFRRLNTSFAVLPPRRVIPQECVKFEDSVFPRLYDTVIVGSASVGLIFYFCDRPGVYGATIRDTRADGLHFANCQDAYADNVRTENTGDDGVAFLNYGDSVDYYGGQATNLTVINSGTRGITVVGQRDVVIDGFEVDGSFAAGILVGYEEPYTTRVPRNVLFKNGTIRRAGKAPEGNGGGQPIPAGILCYIVGSSIRFINVSSEDGADDGVYVEARSFQRKNPDGSYTPQPPGSVYFDGVSLRNTPELGFHCFGGYITMVGGCAARETGKTGMWFEDCEEVRYGQLTAENTSKNSSLSRAFNFEENKLVGTAPGASLHELVVADAQASPTGYIVNTYGDQQEGDLGRIIDQVANGDVIVQNGSGLTYETA